MLIQLRDGVLSSQHKVNSFHQLTGTIFDMKIYILLYIYPLILAVEEFTHKAGNIKKLSVFSKMLASSFSKDNESLHVDILTYTDLALLKAARKGNNTSSNDVKPNSSMTQSKQNPEQWQKRYIILTYRGEFNHNHYPLPLDFEDKPNFPALKRTIARLRKHILNKENEEKEPATAKER